MTLARQSLGRWGEEAASAFLQERGFQVVARNLRTPLGEIDLIVRQGRDLVFVEVKTRRTARFGAPQDAVTVRKQRQIIRAAQWYLGSGRHGGLQPRFDVVAVLASAAGPRIEHIANAFTL
ncbi:YraN family protein [Geoalkalibacter sp.]|uniref:YraN family protein n=1 Tax=Geoalkalibacter sp. TaxID=3041440 RepID=UPI00272EA17D|nr:YraN family protein [Geoalkalibacter sp.]